MEQLSNVLMSLKQGNYQQTYVCQETLHLEICKKKDKSQFLIFFDLVSNA